MLRLLSTAQISELKSWLLKTIHWMQVRINMQEAVIHRILPDMARIANWGCNE